MSGPAAQHVLHVLAKDQQAGRLVDLVRERDLLVRVTIAEDDAALEAALPEADVLVSSYLSAIDLAKGERLRLVQSAGAGVDQIPIERLPAGCVLCNVHEHERASGEWVLMVMLALSRRLLPAHDDLTRGIWNEAVHAEDTPDRLLAGRTLGIVGLGPLGREAARLARLLGMHVVAATRTPAPDRPGAELVDWLTGLDGLDEVLERADFALLSLPLTEATHGLIGRPELERLGPDGYLLNIARGPIVQENALYEALRDGVIAGAALDVFWNDPKGAKVATMPWSRPFQELRNVVLTPWSSGWVADVPANRWHFIASQLERLLRREPLENVVMTA